MVNLANNALRKVPEIIQWGGVRLAMVEDRGRETKLTSVGD
ncbi:hypothetical protein SAMN06265222_105197 [Neorhodopirellula lusitana]|uniref:Uncharacterized protein n=1 Tax=Neorhodopirellula lusitana TaxID=445327 RepID=A0ABY1Q1U9_9BACT|nr:hypothetical protein SAMN06265222_105197 [Neorhodopirellula lusitana]